MKSYLATDVFNASLHRHQLLDKIGIEPEKTIAILYDLINPRENTLGLLAVKNLRTIRGYQIADFAMALENSWIQEVPDYIILYIFSGSVWLDEKFYKVGLIEESFVYYDLVK